MCFLIVCLMLLILSVCLGEKFLKEDEVILFLLDWDSMIVLVIDQVMGIFKVQESVQELFSVFDMLLEGFVMDIKMWFEKEL